MSEHVISFTVQDLPRRRRFPASFRTCQRRRLSVWIRFFFGCFRRKLLVKLTRRERRLSVWIGRRQGKGRRGSRASRGRRRGFGFRRWRFEVSVIEFGDGDGRSELEILVVDRREDETVALGENWRFSDDNHWRNRIQWLNQVLLTVKRFIFCHLIWAGRVIDYARERGCVGEEDEEGNPWKFSNLWDPKNTRFVFCLLIRWFTFVFILLNVDVTFARAA